MRVRIRLFAVQRELVGARNLTLELADGATIEEAWASLVEQHPVLAPGRPSVRFARNAAYAAPTTSLEPDDELAIIPPVSGGAAGPEREIQARRRIVELRAEPFDAGILADLARRLAVPADGAVVAFLGVTRATPGTPAPGQEAEAGRHAGREVEALDYEAHEAMARAVSDEIAGEIEERFGVTRLGLVHRTGEVPLGEASVAIVACAPHREAAFDAARYAIDETKARAPIWKAERFSDGHVWMGAPAREMPTSPASPPGSSPDR
jgi:MoaE-MoaD fusion protein